MIKALSRRRNYSMERKTNGAKHDDGKARMDLIDPDFELGMANVLTHGVKLHGEGSWKTVEEAEKRFLAALKRHTNAMARGEVFDDGDGGTGETHAACIGVNAMFLEWFQRGAKGLIRNLQIPK